MNEKNSIMGLERAFPLSGLRAFDAAARLGSFRAAADALGVTPSAVSHQIKALEREIGSPLFHRQGRDVVLSEAGASLAPFVRQGFLAFDRGTALVRGRTRARQIRVSALAFFSQAILIPNLAKFSTRWPDYDVRIEVTTRYVDFDRDDVDLAIRYGTGRWSGLECTELLCISGMPVATRAYLAERRLHKPADLAAARLIHDSAQPRAWSAWLGAQGVSQRDESRDLWFDSAPATLQAAEQSLGIALAIDPLVHLWPGFGKRLVAAFPGLTGPRARYWLVRRPESDVDPKIKAFISWVRAACRSVDRAEHPA